MLITPQNTPVEDWELRSDADGPVRAFSHVPGDGRVSLLRFDLGRLIERPVRVHSADLVLAVTGPPGAAGEISVGTITTDWRRGSLSWSAPWSTPGMAEDVDFEPLRVIPVVTPDSGSLLKVKLGVSEDLRRWLSGRLPNFGWRISASVTYGGARNVIQAAQPTLCVKYSDGAGAAAGAGISTGAL